MLIFQILGGFKGSTFEILGDIIARSQVPSVTLFVIQMVILIGMSNSFERKEGETAGRAGAGLASKRAGKLDVSLVFKYLMI